MSVQTSYTINHAEAYAGMVADQQLRNTTTGLNTDSATIPYGKGVVRDGERGINLPGSSDTAADFKGVVVRELNRDYADGDTFGAPVDRDATVLTAGVIWVTAASDSIAVGEAAYLRVGATNPGDFANAAGTGATLSVAIPNARFLTAGDTGDLVKVSFVIGG